LIPSAAGLAAVMMAALVLFSGCRSMTPLDVAARSLVSTVQTVDSAMQGFTTADALGLVSADEQAQVRKLYADYQAAESVAEVAIITAIKSKDAGSLAAAFAALDAAKIPLLQFLARFTTSPPTP
jgi:hypothetical protein